MHGIIGLPPARSDLTFLNTSSAADAVAFFPTLPLGDDAFLGDGLCLAFAAVSSLPSLAAQTRSTRLRAY